MTENTCRASTSPSGTAGGFSLTELMIVVVIIGVLAAIGYPAYQNYAREAKRSDAHAALNRIAAQQERFFSNNNAYSSTLVGLGYTSAVAASPEGYWNLDVSAFTTTTFTVRAQPGGTKAHTDPDCANITLNSLGVKGGTNTECW